VSRIAAAACAAVVLAVLASASLVNPSPAKADNCQAEELILRTIFNDPNAESPIADEADPRCIYLAYAGCPNLQSPVECVSGALNYEQWLLGCGSRTNPTGFCAPPRP